MTHQTIRIELQASSLGTSRHIVAHRFGDPEHGPRVYIQAGIHADEAPAMLVAHHLIQQLQARAGDLLGSVTIVPYANPIGLSQRTLALHVGRGDLGVGGNFNRRFPNLGQAAHRALEGRLTGDPQQDRELAHAALAAALAEVPALDDLASLRKTLLGLAIGADFVLDLHTHYEGTVYMYTNAIDPKAAAELGRLTGCRAVLEDTGGAVADGALTLDQACDTAWRALGGLGVAHGCFTATLEYRGQMDTSDALARADAMALIAFLIRQGVLTGDATPLPEALCQHTPVEAVAHLVSAVPGITVFHCAPGDKVRKGDLVAEVVDPAEADPSKARHALRAPCDGVLFGRLISRIARPGLVLGSIAAASVGEVPAFAGDPYP